jgi:hypothetical protein
LNPAETDLSGSEPSMLPLYGIYMNDWGGTIITIHLEYLRIASSVEKGDQRFYFENVFVIGENYVFRKTFS